MYFRNFLVLNGVRVSNPQWLTSTQILVEHSPGSKTALDCLTLCDVVVQLVIGHWCIWTPLMAGGSFFFLLFFLSCSFHSLFSVCVTYSWIKRSTLMGFFYGIRDPKKHEKRDLSWGPHAREADRDGSSLMPFLLGNHTDPDFSL